jgi:DNA-binding beta-propeller fold protein YncE
VAAVALNVTVTEPSATGYLTAYPTGTTRPLASNLNFGPGQTVPNAVVVKLGTLGRVSFYNNAGTTHLIADVAGWYASGADVGESYRSLSPTRLLDTRPSAVVPAGGTVRVNASQELPSGVTAVALNVTFTTPSSVGYLTVYPAGDTRPLASNLNLVPGGTRANFVAVPVGQDGAVDIYASGQTHVVVDRLGYWGGQANGRLTPMSPVRVVDTRIGLGGRSQPLGPGTTMDVDLSGVAGIPEGRPSGVVLNLTSVAPTAVGFLTVHPAGQTRPLASNLNAVPNDIIPNLVIATVDPSGRASIYNHAGRTDVVVDVVGWFDRPVFTLPKAGVNGEFTFEGNAVNPADVVIDRTSTFAFITNPQFNRVEVLRLSTGVFETPIAVGSSPRGIDISPAGDRLYVANRGGTQISVVDVAGRSELKRIQIPTRDHPSTKPYSVAALANGHLLVATSFAGSGFGAGMYDIDLADDTVRFRNDFWYGGTTTQRTVVRASADRQHAVIVAGDISSGPVFRYDVASDTFTPESDLNAFIAHVAANADASVIFVNGGGYVLDEDMVLAGSASSCHGAGVALNAPGTAAYSLAAHHIAVCDVNRFLMADVIHTYDEADWYTYLNNHVMRLSPDGTTLVALTGSGVTLVRL